MFSALSWALDHLIRRHVAIKVRVHHGWLSPYPNVTYSVTEYWEDRAAYVQQVGAEAYAGADAEQRAMMDRLKSVEAYFINVTNASPNRTVGITHVWFATEPEVPVLARRPPPTLAPDEQWETWLAAHLLPPAYQTQERVGEVPSLARVKLTSGRVIESSARDDVPAVGHIPG